MEIWEQIQDCKGYYKVSTNGNVLSVRSGKLLIPRNRSTGYVFVSLCVDGDETIESIHRLVALQYIPNPENKPTVNHKNGIKTDNRVENLEWATHEENIRHSFKYLGQSNQLGIIAAAKARTGKPSKNRIPVTMVDCNGKELMKFDHYRQAAEYVNGIPQAFYLLKIGRIKTYKGYSWKIG